MKKIAIIFFLAFALRFSFFTFWHASGNGNRIASDAGGYVQIAQNITAGRGFEWEGQPTTRRPPLYPLYMSLFVALHAYPWGIQLADGFLSALSCMMLFWIARDLFDEKSALLGAIFLAVDYISIRQSVAVMPETLFVFFLLVCFFILFRAIKSLRPALFFAAGIAAGAVLLTRDVLIFYFPLAAASLFFLKAPWRTRMIAFAVFLAGLIMTISPWMVRNSLICGRPAMITVTAGNTFYIANNPRATGGRTGGDWEWEVDSAYPKDAYFLSLTGEEADRYLLGLALDFIRDEPAKFFYLMQRKIWNMWRPYQSNSPRMTRWISALEYILVMFFAVYGFFKSRLDWRRLLPIYSLFAYLFAIHAVLISSIRYRYPAMPFFMIFGAFGVVAAIRKLRNPKGGQPSLFPRDSRVAVAAP